MTQRMLADLGRLTLLFAALDEHLSWAYDVLHPEGRETARVRRPEPFKIRATNAADFVRSTAKRLSLQSHAKVTEYLALLKELEGIAHDRNMYIHGKIAELPDVDLRFVTHQPPKGETRQQEITHETLPALNERITKASAQFVHLTLDVYKILNAKAK